MWQWTTTGGVQDPPHVITPLCLMDPGVHLIYLVDPRVRRAVDHGHKGPKDWGKVHLLEVYEPGHSDDVKG